MNKTKIVAPAFAFLGILGVTAPVYAQGEQTSKGEINLIAPTNPGEGGNVQLDSVTDFSFGSQEISGDKKSYSLDSTVETTPTVISDLRGTGEGWQVTAKITPFTDKESGKELKSAALKLTSGELTSSSEGVATPPEAKEVELNENEEVIITAAKDSGLGTWSKDYSGATLTVPGGNYEGNYAAEITWTLTDGPF